MSDLVLQAVELIRGSSEAQELVAMVGKRPTAHLVVRDWLEERDIRFTLPISKTGMPELDEAKLWDVLDHVNGGHLQNEKWGWLNSRPASYTHQVPSGRIEHLACYHERQEFEFNVSRMALGTQGTVGSIREIEVSIYIYRALGCPLVWVSSGIIPPIMLSALSIEEIRFRFYERLRDITSDKWPATRGTSRWP